MIEITAADFLLMWTITLVYAMWKTHSFHSCLNLSTIVFTLLFTTFIHRLFGDPDEGVRCLSMVLTVVTVLVWKEVPKLNRKRRWSDAK